MPRLLLRPSVPPKPPPPPRSGSAATADPKQRGKFCRDREDAKRAANEVLSKATIARAMATTGRTSSRRRRNPIRDRVHAAGPIAETNVQGNALANSSGCQTARPASRPCFRTSSSLQSWRHHRALHGDVRAAQSISSFTCRGVRHSTQCWRPDQPLIRLETAQTPPRQQPAAGAQRCGFRRIFN